MTYAIAPSTVTVNEGDGTVTFTVSRSDATAAATVYASTVLYWLGDESEGHAATWAFLDRRIDDVLQIPKIQARITDAIGAFVPPLNASRRGRASRRRRPV